MNEAQRRQKGREAGLKASKTKGPQRRKEAAVKAAETKGEEERRREALMAAWTRKHGKDDTANPYSKQNYRGG
jgi:hypothetical protein